ncbi:MAG TPA: hypothetical protein VJ869_00755 [Sphaerochaeta sp.]|nr:hypothetical protein [Sphaerochaeta sp.]
MTNLEQCLLAGEHNKYWKPIHAVSDSLAEFLSDCSRKVFHFESFCNADKNLTQVHKVDAIAIRRKNTQHTEINLLEFKGGKTCTDWNKDCFALKAFDTLHCGFPKLVGNDRRAWSNLFSDEELIFNFYIIISDNHIIARADTNPKKIITERDTQQKAREQLDNFQKTLHRYENKHPFDFIKVTSASRFREKINTIVDVINI